MDPITLMEEIRTKYQAAADILGLDYSTATTEEQGLIIEMSTVKQHHIEWFEGIGGWNGSKHPW